MEVGACHGGHGDDGGVELRVVKEFGQVLGHTKVALVGYHDRGQGGYVPQEVVGDEVVYNLEGKGWESRQNRTGQVEKT